MIYTYLIEVDSLCSSVTTGRPIWTSKARRLVPLATTVLYWVEQYESYCVLKDRDGFITDDMLRRLAPPSHACGTRGVGL